MEVITSNQTVPEDRGHFVVCEICDRAEADIAGYHCKDEDCSKCSMTFDKFVCSECTHTKSLEEMEQIYMKKHDLQAESATASSSSEEDSNATEETTQEETRHTTELIENMTRSFSDFEESEQLEHHQTISSTVPTIDDGDKEMYTNHSDDTDEEDHIEKNSINGEEETQVEGVVNETEYIYERTCSVDNELTIKKQEEEKGEIQDNYRSKFDKILREISIEKNVEEEPATETVVPQRTDFVRSLDEKQCREEYEKTIKSLGELREYEYENSPSTPTLLQRQNGMEEEREEILSYNGPIPLRVKVTEKQNFFEETECESEVIEEEEEIIRAEGYQSKIKYFEDYQENNDSGTEADIEERLMQTHKEEILERIPEDDEVSSSTNHMAEELVQATLIGAVKDFDRQDSAISYASVDKFYEERDFEHVSRDYIRGTSLEDHAIRSTASPTINNNYVDSDSESDSDYENKYTPLYEHIKAQKLVNRDIRMIRGLLEEKYKIKIISNELDDVVKAKEEILDKFNIDLGYHEVYNYMERNRLRKRVELGTEKAISCLSSLGYQMEREVTREEDQVLENRIMQICDYVEQGKTLDDIPNSKVDEAVKLACEYFEEKMNIKMVQKNRSWRQKQDEVISMMDNYRRQNPASFNDDDDTSASESEEEEIYSEMTEEIRRTSTMTPISFRNKPVSDHVEAIDEGYERVRKSFGQDHEVKVNAMVQITEDLKENIEKLSKLFPGKIKFEIETIPITVKETITEFNTEIKSDLNAARHVLEKVVEPSREKFDIGVFFKNFISKFKGSESTV